MKRFAMPPAIAAASFAGCASFGVVTAPPDLDTHEGLASALASGEDVIVYQVPTTEECATGPIPGAIVYCASGGRSHREAIRDSVPSP